MQDRAEDRLPRVRHRKRAAFRARECLVTARIDDGLPGLRGAETERLLREAIELAGERFACRLLRFSAAPGELHLIVEARDQASLGRAIKGLLVRLARGLNKLWGRSGRVFDDRFRVAVLTPAGDAPRSPPGTPARGRRPSSRRRP